MNFMKFQFPNMDVSRALLVVFLSNTTTISCSETNREQITGEIHVITDDRKSLEGSRIQLYFLQDEIYFQREGKWNYIETKILDEKNKTTFEGRGYKMNISLELDGYWSGTKEQYPAYKKDSSGKLSPVNANVQILLRKKTAPRPLYVKYDTLHLSDFNTKYGYDLAKGALVRPYGKGTVSDFYFTVTGVVDEKADLFDVTITMSFPEKGDGILPILRNNAGESELFLGQLAPTEGYQPEMSLRITRKLGEAFGRLKPEPTTYTSIAGMERSNLEGFWFRTHSVIDTTTGQVVKARYGKLGADFGGGIKFAFIEKSLAHYQHARVSFFYFYSPDDSTSLEFNGSNLLPQPDDSNSNYFPSDKH